MCKTVLLLPVVSSLSYQISGPDQWFNQFKTKLDVVNLIIDSCVFLILKCVSQINKGTPELCDKGLPDPIQAITNELTRITELILN